jgi:hypothetical protein
MTLEQARAELSNALYEASELFERLEGAGLVSGNGHHLRQAVVAFAVRELDNSWCGKDRTS